MNHFLGIESKAIARLVMAVIANRRETPYHRCEIQAEDIQLSKIENLFPIRKPREQLHPPESRSAIFDFPSTTSRDHGDARRYA